MEDQRIAFLKSTETGAITDAMKLIGISGWMDGIHPANPASKICGRAFTIQFSTVRDPMQKTYNMFEVFDHCKPGDVVVVSAPHAGAVVGENMMFALAGKGVAGMVLDGKTRDWGVIIESGIPHFSRGPAIMVPADFKITAVQVPIVCGGAVVEPGDYIVGDVDGVISLPQARIDDVIYQAEMVSQVEQEMDQAIKHGIEMQDLIKISQKKKIPRPINGDKKE